MEQRTQEWLDFRKNKIGASDAPVIMGVSPWKTRHQLWLEKLGFWEQQSNSSMKRGNDLEETARNYYREQYGEMIPTVVMHPKYEWMIASLDGLSSDGTRALEIKCPGEKDHFQASKKKVPEKYYPQLQHQLEVLGHEMLHYLSFYKGEMIVFPVMRDEKYIKRLIEEEKKFWDMVQNLEPPELSDRDYVQRDDEEWKQTALRFAEIKAEKARIEKEEEECKKNLLSLAGDFSTKGCGVTVRKVIRKGSVNYQSIPEIKKIDLEKYRKPSSIYWTISNYDTA